MFIFSHAFSKRLYVVLWLPLLLLLPIHVLAQQPTVEISEAAPLQLLSHVLYVYEDSSASLDFNKIQQKKEAFSLNKSENINFGYTASAIWVYFNITNLTTSPLLVENSANTIDHLEFYAVDAKGQLLDQLEAGRLLPFNNRSFEMAYPNFKLPKDTHRVYVKASSNGSISLPLHLGTIESVIADAHRFDVLNSIMLGLVLFMLIYSFLRWLFNKDVLYLYYIPLLAITGAATTRISGYDSWLLPALSPYWSIIIPLLTALCLPFYLKFLEITKTRYRGFYFALVTLTAGYAILIVLAILGYKRVSEQFFVLLTLPLMLTVVTAACWVYLKGYKPAIFFILAYACLTAGVIVSFLFILGVLPYSLWTVNAISIGSSLQVILFTLAIADKLETYKKETITLKQKALEQAETHAKELDQKVKERTEELQASEEELRQNLEELQATQEALAMRNAEVIEKEQTLRRIFDGIPAMICQFMWDKEGNTSFPVVSKGSRKVYGLDPEIIMKDANSILGQVHPDDITRFQNSIAESAQSLSIWHEEFRTLVDGKEKWMEGFSKPERLADGSIIWSGMVMDIQERKTMELDLIYAHEGLQASEEELRQNLEELQTTQEALAAINAEVLEKEQTLRRIFDGVPAMIYQFMLDKEGKMSFPVVSKGSQKVYGLAPEIIIEDANKVIGQIHPDDITRFQNSIAESAQNMSIWQEEFRTLVDGEMKWIEGFSKPELLADGSIIWSGMVMDIQERKTMELDLIYAHEGLQASEEELRQNLEELQTTQEALAAINAEVLEKEQTLRRIFDGAPAMIYQFKLDKDGKMSFPVVSKGAKQVYGLDPEAIMENANNVIGQIHPDDITRFQNSVAESAQNMTIWQEEFRTLVDGEMKWIEGVSKPELLADGSIIWSGMVMDIQARKEIELELANKQSEIIASRDSLKEALEEVKFQKTLVDKKHANIMASLQYARRMQRSMLPQVRLTEHVPESFVFFKSRELVSGDFYWIYDTPKHLFIATMDCTGHGVPGAFMSLIGIALLNEAVINRRIHNPHRILQMMQIGLTRRLKRKDQHTREGMEGAICVLDKKENVLSFAGAKSPLVYIEKGALKIIKGDKAGINIRQKKGNVIDRFTTHNIPIESPTNFYLFSDGYQDQFGGKDNRKFSSKQFRALLLDIHQQSPQEQSRILEERFNEWRGEQKQIDDVLVLGFKLSPEILK